MVGGAPIIEWVREGVGFTPAAAASFRRAEASWGSRIRCNSTYRDYGLQLSMWQAWTAWTEGRGPKPNHSRALHPDESVHCRGEALDTDLWSVPGFIAHMAAHGWIRTAAWDPTEQHHFEYQEWRDEHRFEPALAGKQEEDDMTPEQARQLNSIFNAIFRGGDSMKDGGKSISQSLRDIQDKLAPVTRGGQVVTLRQEIASTRTAVIELLGRDPGSANVEVDEAALAAALAPLITDQMRTLSDEDVTRLARAASDEADRRARERLDS